jgi:hypothetical protein
MRPTTRRRGRGRPTNKTRRDPYQFRLNPQTRARIEAWKEARTKEGGTLDLSSALEQMVELAAAHGRNGTQRLVPVDKLFGSLSPAPGAEWVRIDEKSGQVLHCRRCAATSTVPIVSFQKWMGHIAKFVSQHRHGADDPD